MNTDWNISEQGLIEEWVRNNHQTALFDLCPDGNSNIDKSRTDAKEGGIWVLFRNSLHLEKDVDSVIQYFLNCVIPRERLIDYHLLGCL